MQKPLCENVISYVPFGEEPDPSPFFSSPRIIISKDRYEDPIKKAEDVTAFLEQSRDVCVLVPGKQFDVAGTRHGRGGGWYDRFLSHIPKAWVRIGIASKKQFSKTALKREAWDEPVHWVCIVDGGMAHFIKIS